MRIHIGLLCERGGRDERASRWEKREREREEEILLLDLSSYRTVLQHDGFRLESALGRAPAPRHWAQTHRK
mgnify:CR=1 FL=1